MKREKLFVDSPLAHSRAWNIIERDDVVGDGEGNPGRSVGVQWGYTTHRPRFRGSIYIKKERRIVFTSVAMRAYNPGHGTDIDTLSALAFVVPCPHSLFYSCEPIVWCLARAIPPRPRNLSNSLR